MEKLYTAKEVSKILHLNIQTTQRFFREGRIKSVQSGRQYLASESALNEFLNLSPQSTPAQVDIPVGEKV